MSSVNIEDEQDPFASQSDPLPSSILNFMQSTDLLKDNRLSEDLRDNNTINSSSDGRKISLNELNSSKVSAQRPKQERIKSVDPKKKDVRKTLREPTSPNSLNSSDISYKILNEMLNTQSGDRFQLKTKNISKVEGKKESTTDLLNTTKTFLEEIDDIKVLQEKIFSLNGQINSKFDSFQEYKKFHEIENNRLNETEAKLKENHETLTSKLEEIQKKKTEHKEKLDLNASREKLKKLTHEAENHQKEIIKLDEMIAKQEKDREMREKLIESEFEDQIKELENSFQSVQNQKLSIHAKLDQIEESHNEIFEKKAMLKEDLNARLLQRAELVAQREELDQAIENFKEKHSFELEFYNFELKAKTSFEDFTKNLNRLTIEKKKQLARLKEITNQITHLNDQLFLTAKDHQILINEKNDKIIENSLEIKSMETMINEKAHLLELPDLNEIFTKLYNSFGGHIGQEVVLNQLYLIEQGEEKLRTSFESKKENISQAISILAKRKADSEAAANISKLTNKIKQLELSYEIEKEALLKFKNRVKESLILKENKVGSTSSVKGNEFQQAIQIIEIVSCQKNIGEEKRKDFKRMIEKYFGLLASNETFICQKLQDESVLQEEERIIEEQVTKAKEQRALVNKEIKRIDDEYALIAQNKKQLENELQEKRNAVEQFVMKEAETAFNAYLTEQAGTFETINRTYGPKLNGQATQNVKKEHFKEFIDITKNNFGKKIERLKDLQNELDQLDNIIKKNMHVVDEEVLPMFKKIVASLNEQKDLSSNLKKNQIILLEKEDKINEELKNVIEKQNQKKQMTKEDFDKTTLQSLKHLRDTKKVFERRLKNMQEEITRLENLIIDCDKLNTQDLLEINLQEKKIQRELKQIETNLEEIEKVRKPKLKDLEIEMERLDKEILKDRKRLDHLEIQRLTFEQNFVEQNYLNEDFPQQNTIGSYAIFNERNSDFNTSVHEDLGINKNEEKWRNLELSPIKYSFDSNERVRKKEMFDENLPAYHSLVSTQQVISADDYQSNENTSSYSQTKPNFSRKTNSRNSNIQENSFISSSHKRNESVPSLIAALEKQKVSKNSKPGPNTFSVNIKNLMEAATHQKRFSFDPLNNNQPKASFSSNRYQKEENNSQVNLPFQKHKVPNQQKILSDQTNMQNNQNYRFSYDSAPSFNHSKDQESFVKPGHQNKPLITIDEEQSTSRDIYRNLRRSQGLNMMHNSQSKENQKTSIFASNEYRSSSQKLHSTTKSNLRNSIERISTEECNNLELQKSSKQNILSFNLNKSQIPIFKRFPDSKSSIRSKSLEAHHNLSTALEINHDENIENRPPSQLNIAQYASVPSENQSKHMLRRSVEFNQTVNPALKIENYSAHDLQLIEIIRPLLEGSFLFKKFSNNQSLKKGAFDPLTGETHPPESCGYGMRHIKLHPNLEKIEIKHAFKPGTEMTISIASILRPVVPQVTMDILKVQKRMIELQNAFLHLDGKPMGDHYSNINAKPLLLQRGANNPLNLDTYTSCNYYPFSVLLERGGRIEFVAPNYGAFKEWIAGMNYLIKNKKNLPKIKKRFEELIVQ